MISSNWFPLLESRGIQLVFKIYYKKEKNPKISKQSKLKLEKREKLFQIFANFVEHVVKINKLKRIAVCSRQKMYIFKNALHWEE